MKDMKPYQKKVINAKSAAHMVAIANNMAGNNKKMPAPTKGWTPKN